MSLIHLHSDMGRGWMHTSVYIEGEQIESIVPLTDQYHSPDNRTIITLKSGDKKYIIERTEVIYALLNPEPKP